jgi:hypothetical protein
VLPSGRGGGGGELPDTNILLITHFLSIKKSYFLKNYKSLYVKSL